jgi:hypothetical protein
LGAVNWRDQSARVLVVALLTWRNEQKETYVFVRDSLGNVVQADAT